MRPISTELEKWLQTPNTACRPVVEAIRPQQQDIREEQSEWTGSGSGLTFPEIGGARLTGTNATRAQHDTASADQENTVTDLDNASRWFMLELEWLADAASDWELHRLTATLDPDVDGTGREVSEFRARLFRVAEESSDYVQLQPIGTRASVAVSGNSQADFTFTFFGGDLGSPIRAGDSAEGNANPKTYIQITAHKSDGSAAGNVAWVGDNDDTASGTGVDDGSAPDTATARLRELDRRDDAQAFTLGGEYEKFGSGDGIPDFSLDGQTYSAATATFTDIDMGAAPGADTDIRLIGVGAEPGGSSLTWEVSDDSGSTWTEYIDGDIIGEDNTDVGGKDLSGVSRQQTYQLRVTLTPSGGQTPEARRIGVEELETTMLEGLGSMQSVRWSFDPIELVAEIPEAAVRVIKDGVRDYRSQGEELFSEHHIGDLELRVWIGHPDLARRHWLHVEDFVVDDIEPAGAAVEVTALSPLQRLNNGIPPFDTANDERTPVTYSNQTLKGAWDDLLDAQVALPARYRGPGVEDTSSETVARVIEDSTGKTELDAIAHLAGGVAASSQGRVRFQPVFIDSGVRDVFYRDEIDVVAATPGFRDRMAEYYVRYGYDRDADTYKGEVRSFHSDSITKLDRAFIEAPEELRDEVAKWLPDPQDTNSSDPSTNLAAAVAARTTDELGTGLKQVRFNVSSYPRPHLEIGDPVAVQTDALVFRHPESDQPLRGLLWLIGVVQAQEDVMGTRFTVWVQQVFDATPNEVDGSRVSFASPEVSSVTLNIDDSGSVNAVVKVSPDTGSIRYATSTSAFPNKSTTQSGTVVATSGRQAEISGVATVNRTQTLFTSVLAYEDSSGGGAESTDVTTARETFRKDESPKFNWIELQKVEDDGTDDTYFVDWAVNAAVENCASGWRVKVFCYKNGAFATEDIFCPGAAPVQIVDGGAGDGSSDTHHVRLELYEELIAHAGNREYQNTESPELQSAAVGGSGPTNLSAAFRTVPCDVDLSWDADSTNSQDVYRCSGSGCDPVVDGSKVADVSAGTSSHSDDVSGVSANTILNYAVQSSAGTSNTANTFRSSC